MFSCIALSGCLKQQCIYKSKSLINGDEVINFNTSFQQTFIIQTAFCQKPFK